MAWVDRFGLDGRVVTVDRARVGGGADAQYGVRPVDAMREMPAVLKPLTTVQQLAAVALLALCDGEEAQAVFEGKRRAAMPPAVEGFATLREAAGEAAYAHLMRLIAAYRGW